jgi:hypothetical protein
MGKWTINGWSLPKNLQTQKLSTNLVEEELAKPLNENCKKHTNSIAVTTKTSFLLGTIFFLKSFIS